MPATRRLVIGTTNRGKLAEFETLLADSGYEVRGLSDYPPQPEVVEDGATFEANAEKKALAWARSLGELVLADDSGLEVDALGGQPGLHSARFAGPNQDSKANLAKLLDEMRGVPESERGARFVCVLAIAGPEGVQTTIRGECYGRILTAARGTSGFGYDPVFFYPPLSKTFAEMDSHEKNAVSHRGKATAQLRSLLERSGGASDV